MKDGKRVVITYGTYDMFHFGHEALLKRAKELGDYLIVGVTSDDFDRIRGKLNVCQSFSERAQGVWRSGYADLIIAEEYQGQKISDIRKYGVDVFAIGSDWEGKFDHLKRYCDVVYLPRTEGVSSTELRAEISTEVRVGIIGADYLSARIVRESSHVSDFKAVAVYPFEGQDVAAFAQEAGRDDLSVVSSVQELCAMADAVYITAPINRRASFIRQALEAGCHVACEGPMFLSRAEGEELYALAEEKGLVIFETDKTLYYPAFERLRWLLESGVVGEIKDIRVAFSQILPNIDMSDKYQGSFYDLASYLLIPPLIFLGENPLDVRLISYFEGDFSVWTKCELLYESASATLLAGRNMKTEGDMVITGTNGYVYVPAPWWKTDYFEVRGEDLRDTKKYYFGCAGEGQRYEEFEFLRLIRGVGGNYTPMQTRESVLAMTDLVERFDKGDVIRLGKGALNFGGGETITDR